MSAHAAVWRAAAAVRSEGGGGNATTPRAERKGDDKGAARDGDGGQARCCAKECDESEGANGPRDDEGGPAVWFEAWDQGEGACYYVDSRSGESRWEPPRGGHTPLAAAAAEGTTTATEEEETDDDDAQKAERAQAGQRHSRSADATPGEVGATAANAKAEAKA
jgi:hypothetical protein